MAASILKGALPKTREGTEIAQELIANSDEDYEDKAIRLASGLIYQEVPGGCFVGGGRLAEIRRVLYQHRWTCPLFDTHRWVADLECAYEEAWRRWVLGEAGDIHL